MSTLKKGDKIRARVDHPHGGMVRAGEIGVIYDPDGIVNFPSQPNYMFTTPLDEAKFELLMEVKELTSLPEKWCIKVTVENVKVIGDWRTVGPCNAKGYCMCRENNVDGYWTPEKPEGYTEITFDQFKKWVLGESSVISASAANGVCNTVAPTPDKEHKTESLLEEAKRRYPVGTKVKGIHLGHGVVIGTNSFEVSSSDFCIRHRGSNGAFDALYDSNWGGGPTWAEIISKPAFPILHEKKSLIQSAMDSSVINKNGVPEYVEVIKNVGVAVKGEILRSKEEGGSFKWHYNPNLNKCYQSWDQWGGTKWGDSLTLEHFKPSTREAYDAQFKKQEDFGTISSGLLSPDVGPIWNKGLRDYPSSYAGTGGPMLGGVGSLSSGLGFWEALESVTPFYDAVKLSKESPPKTQPSSKVSVNTHEEFKITINKPKSIKI